MLDISHNNISGTFPYWLESLPELQILVLRSNQFHGIIQSSDSVNSFPNLRVFDIANNGFTGPLPEGLIRNMKALMNLNQEQTSLQYMRKYYHFYTLELSMKGLYFGFDILTTSTAVDLSNNNFYGETPGVVGRLCSLRGLNLSHNNLSGHIPASMTKLEWLDLSWNMLNGQIPNQLMDLTFLAFLNLSYNQLTGPIPHNQQFSTFENGSYQGNLGLCGPPLSEACGEKNGRKQSPPEEADGPEISWKVVWLGYGCGVVFEIIAGYVTFRNGEPKWYIKLFVKHHRKERKSCKN